MFAEKKRSKNEEIIKKKPKGCLAMVNVDMMYMVE